jgi:hypothetical protein
MRSGALKLRPDSKAADNRWRTCSSRIGRPTASAGFTTRRDGFQQIDDVIVAEDAGYCNFR